MRANQKRITNIKDTELDILSIDDLPDRDTDEYSDSEQNKEKNNNKKQKRTSSAQKERQKKENTSKKKRSAPSASALVSPVKKTVQTGARLTGKILQMGARGVTLLMIAVITFIIFKNFWSNYAVYGALNTAINARNYTLGAFLGVAAFLIIMEIIFFLWALTGPYVSNGRGVHHADTGRGLFSFIFIGATVILSGIFYHLIPASPVPLTGLSGGLQLYGSLKGILLPLCIIGIISCIVRKIFSR